MTKLVPDSVMHAAIDNDILLGSTQPSRETKGAHYEVYLASDNKIIACVCTDDWSVCGEEIEAKDISMYVDDTAKAVKLLEKHRK